MLLTCVSMDDAMLSREKLNIEANFMAHTGALTTQVSVSIVSKIVNVPELQFRGQIYRTEGNSSYD